MFNYESDNHYHMHGGPHDSRRCDVNKLNKTIVVWLNSFGRRTDIFWKGSPPRHLFQLCNGINYWWLRHIGIWSPFIEFGLIKRTDRVTKMASSHTFICKRWARQENSREFTSEVNWRLQCKWWFARRPQLCPWEVVGHAELFTLCALPRPDSRKVTLSGLAAESPCSFRAIAFKWG